MFGFGFKHLSQLCSLKPVWHLFSLDGEVITATYHVLILLSLLNNADTNGGLTFWSCDDI
jgi:hypothetical protein